MADLFFDLGIARSRPSEETEKKLTIFEDLFKREDQISTDELMESTILSSKLMMESTTEYSRQRIPSVGQWRFGPYYVIFGPFHRDQSVTCAERDSYFQKYQNL